ncbi:MAG: hypothetical protein ACRDIX_01225 [Actinomycetota bacterium]
MAIREALANCADWEDPRSFEGNSLRLACRLAKPADADEIAEAWSDQELPPGAEDLWLTCRDADLFVDVDYGQWGLKLLSPTASAARSARERDARRADFREGDVIIGEFLGDQDLVVIDDSGRVLVALPLDGRADWPRPAVSLAEFLSDYVSANGAKYWETSSS